MPLKQIRKWNVEEEERAGCTGESGHAWERASRPRWLTAALLLTYTQSRAVETVVCVAEQQLPTTGGQPALTHYTLWWRVNLQHAGLLTLTQECSLQTLQHEITFTNRQKKSFRLNKHTLYREACLYYEMFLSPKSTTLDLLNKLQCL